MNYDDSIRKNWFVLDNGQWFSSSPKDENEAEYFAYVKSEAHRCGWKVTEVWFNKTEKEFMNRF